MARLKGGTHVAGDMTVEGLLTTGGIQLDINRTIIFSGAGDLTINRISKGSAFNELIDSSIIDTGSLVTIDVNTRVAADLEVTGNLHAASIYLEEDGNSGNGLRLYNNSGLTADKTLTFNVNNADRTLTISSDISLDQNLLTTFTPTFAKLILTQTTGTAPFTVASTTKVTNLNADLLDGISSASFLRSDATDSASGILSFTNATPSTAITNGAVKIKGGLGVEGDIHASNVYGAVYG